MRHPFLLLAPIPSYPVRQCLVVPSPDGEALHAPSPVAMAQRRTDKHGRDVVTIAPTPMQCFDARPDAFCLVITPTDTETEHWPTRADAAHLEAYALGCEAARNAASWTVDGNTSAEHVRRVLAMLDDGDPQAFDYLPARPDLSGEWADSPTPRSIAADILGADWETHGNNAPDYIDAETVDVLAEAWEAGVSETFEAACETELRAWDLADALSR